MLIDDTIDTLVWNILNEKKKIIGTIMGDDDIITEFINKIEDGSYNVYNERLSLL